VAQLVAGDPYPGALAVPRQLQLDTSDGEPLPVFVDEHGLLLPLWAQPEPGFQRRHRLGRKIHHPFLVAFAAQPQPGQAAGDGIQVQT